MNENNIKINEIILKYFPTAKIYDDIKDKIEIFVKCKNTKILTSERHGNELIIYIYTNTNYMYIASLLKCNGISGSDSLTLIKNLAKELNIKLIKLFDGSFIDYDACSIPLHVLYILMFGESWYNTQEFYSKDYSTEKKYNNDIINLPLSGIFYFYRSQKNTKLKELENEYTIKRNELNNDENSLKNIDKYFNYTIRNTKNQIEVQIKDTIKLFNKLKRKRDIFNKKNMIISDIVKLLFNIIKTEELECDDIELIFLNKILIISSYILSYNSSLEYKIDN